MTKYYELEVLIEIPKQTVILSTSFQVRRKSDGILPTDLTDELSNAGIKFKTISHKTYKISEEDFNEHLDIEA